MNHEESLALQEAEDLLFFEAEAEEGFLVMLETLRFFDWDHWQRIWDAVASLVNHNNGAISIWSNYDLARVVNTVQHYGRELIGRNQHNLDEFEERILEANLFLNEIFTAPE